MVLLSRTGFEYYRETYLVQLRIMDLPTDIFLWTEESDKVTPVSIFIYYFCRDSVEILAVKIMDNGNIQGFRVEQLYGVICFLKNKSSFDEVFYTLNELSGEFSGLKNNHEKTKKLTQRKNTPWNSL